MNHGFSEKYVDNSIGNIFEVIFSFEELSYFFRKILKCDLFVADEGKGEIAPKKLSGVGFGNIFSQAQLSQVKLRPASHVETNGKDKVSL